TGRSQRYVVPPHRTRTGGWGSYCRCTDSRTCATPPNVSPPDAGQAARQRRHFRTGRTSGGALRPGPAPLPPLLVQKPRHTPGCHAFHQIPGAFRRDADTDFGNVAEGDGAGHGPGRVAHQAAGRPALQPVRTSLLSAPTTTWSARRHWSTAARSTAAGWR